MSTRTPPNLGRATDCFSELIKKIASWRSPITTSRASASVSNICLGRDPDVLLGLLKCLPASGSSLIAREPLALLFRLLSGLGRGWPLEKLRIISIVLINVWGPALGRRYQGGLSAGCKGDSGRRCGVGPCRGCQNCPSCPGSGEFPNHSKRGWYTSTDPNDPSAVTLLCLQSAWSRRCMWSNARCFLGGCELACSSILPPSRSP